MTTKWWCAVVAAAALAGCAREETLAEWCHRHPGLGEAPPLAASSLFMEGTVRFETPPRWAARMLANGFRKVETTLSARVDEPYRSWVLEKHHRSVLRFTPARAGDARCTSFERTMRPSADDVREWSRSHASDECIALEFGEATSSEATIYLVDIRPKSPFAYELGVDEQRWEIQLRDLIGNRVHARYHDAGYRAPTRSGSQWVSCGRDDDARRLAALVIPRRHEE